jgi:hypothetical protein
MGLYQSHDSSLTWLTQVGVIIFGLVWFLPKKITKPN